MPYGSARAFLILFIVSLACGPIGWAEIAPVEYVDISPSVVMALNPNGSNLTCIALDDGLVFVDTGLVTEIAADFRTGMEKRFERPTKYLILTHGHIDHIFAMAAFADVEVVAASSEKALFENQLAIEWNEENTAVYSGIFPSFTDALESARPFPPTVWVDDEQVFGSNDTRAVFATTGGHTTGSSYVWFPSEGVLVGGDLVQVDKYPYFGDSTNDLGLWIDALKGWYEMEPQAICPGHGRAVDKDYLRLEWEYFEALIAALTKLKADGVPIEKAVVDASLPTAYWPDQPEPRWWKYCIALSYRTL
jgi:glyoxylase-like metal-dependent hydrolase (beta-lactamase superfamily II)